MTPSSAPSTGSAQTRPVNVGPRSSVGLPMRPALAILMIAALLGLLDANAAGDVADRVDDAVADLVAVAERAGEIERAEAGRRR